MIVLGIDPDRGWALAVHPRPDKERIVAAGSVKGLDEMFEKIRELAVDPELEIDEVRIEQPTSKKPYQREGQTVAAMKKISVNVGENLAKGDAIYFYCLGLGLNAVRTAPIRGGTKLSAKQVKLITGFSGRSNDHMRDAIMIAWMDGVRVNPKRRGRKKAAGRCANV